MPFLFYWPMIVWMGLFDAVQNDMRVPVKVEAKR
jgi:hypothetical protein